MTARSPAPLPATVSAFFDQGPCAAATEAVGDPRQGRESELQMPAFLAAESDTWLYCFSTEEIQLKFVQTAFTEQAIQSFAKPLDGHKPLIILLRDMRPPPRMALRVRAVLTKGIGKRPGSAAPCPGGASPRSGRTLTTRRGGGQTNRRQTPRKSSLTLTFVPV